MKIRLAVPVTVWLVVFTFIPGFVPEGDLYGPNYFSASAEQGEGADMPRNNKRRGPPEEAIAACGGVSEGVACSFESPRGDVIEGSCEITRADVVACVPEGRPPHRPGGPHGDRPPPPDDGEY